MIKRFLIVGNGFDLAHGLLTRYEDFFYLIKNWDSFYTLYRRELENNSEKKKASSSKAVESLPTQKEEDFLGKNLKSVSRAGKVQIARLGKIIKKNTFVHYYCNLGAEIDNWVDFEQELGIIIDLFDDIVNLREIDKSRYQLAKLFPGFLKVGSTVDVAEKYKAPNYGIKKKTLLENLKKEFDEFIEALEIYLTEFVHEESVNNKQKLSQVMEIDADYVINFNYTKTDRKYGIPEENVHRIYGSIRDELNQGRANMVLGVDEKEGRSLDFIYFTKYFQRIQKHTQSRYKDYLNQCGYKLKSWRTGEEKGYEVYIYGHSLASTDGDILKYILEYAKCIHIYYCNQNDYEQKLINLFALYGRKLVEENIENGHYRFVRVREK